MALEKAVLGGGCFWCLDAVFREVNGVQNVVSGYAGSDWPSPMYEQVCSGKTGHAEVVEITFDPAVISFAALLEIFFAIHDPTTLNRQGNDVGTQYRSAIFCQSAAQAEEVDLFIQQVQRQFAAPIVTEVVRQPVVFWPAEGYHQNFFANNPGQGYCQFVVAPKVFKFQQKFPQYQQ